MRLLLTDDKHGHLLTQVESLCIQMCFINVIRPSSKIMQPVKTVVHRNL